MDDDVMHAMDIQDLEMERRLGAFAAARLSPDPRAVARTRARVMREARLQVEAARIAAHVAPAMAVAARRPLARRVAMPLLAASLWLGIAVGSISAAQAGGPLYPTRMWIENATLPAGLVARTNAELDRLDARLGEALSAASRADGPAVAAALDAYRQIADAAVIGSAGDDALEARVGQALDRHQAVLTAVAATLAARGNTTAAAAVGASIQRAIEHNAAVIEVIDRGQTNGNGGAGSGGGASGGGGGSGASSGSGSNGSGAGGTGSGGAGSGGGNAGGGNTGGGSSNGNSSGTSNGTDGNAYGPDANGGHGGGHASAPPSSGTESVPTPLAEPGHTPRGPKN
jgi:hypothetical protein